MGNTVFPMTWGLWQPMVEWTTLFSQQHGYHNDTWLESGWMTPSKEKGTHQVSGLWGGVIGKLAASIQLLVELPSGSSFKRWWIICHLPSPGTRPRGEVWKWPSKMICVSSLEKGPNTHLAKISVVILLMITEGRRFAEVRLSGIKVCHRSSGLLIGEL